MKNKIVYVYFDKSSAPSVYEKVRATYQKGDLFCISLGAGKYVKFPIVNIYSIEEEYEKETIS